MDVRTIMTSISKTKNLLIPAYTEVKIFGSFINIWACPANSRIQRRILYLYLIYRNNRLFGSTTCFIESLNSAICRSGYPFQVLAPFHFAAGFPFLSLTQFHQNKQFSLVHHKSSWNHLPLKLQI